MKHVLIDTGKQCINIKAHYWLRYFRENYTVVPCSKETIKTVLDENNSEETVIVYYTESRDNAEFNAVLWKLLSTTPTFLFKFIYFGFDFWYKDIMLFAANYTVVSFANTQKLSVFQRRDCAAYAPNTVPYNLWCCYNGSFIPFNETPIMKLVVSGVTVQKYYPDRHAVCAAKNMYGINDIAHLRYEKNINASGNFYNRELNKYFAGFSSGVYIRGANAQVLLLKTFEILAAGALLVMPLSEKPLLESIGLFHNKHCYLIDMSRPKIKGQLAHIFRNKVFYTQVRKNGTEFARVHLSENNKMAELNALLNRKLLV